MNEENKHSDVFNELTVDIFNEIILKKVLHLEKESKDIAYIADVSEAHRLINNRDYQIAFILKAPEIMKIKSISHEKERMPYKSTYFYPKLPTGLVMNHFKY